jgi:Cof subfamily protein (haloacid dehalogenase superfamily)
MAIKLITSDLDGTLLNSKKVVSERDRAAIMAAESMGIMVTLASGRSSPEAWAFARMAGISHSPVISNNGPRVQAPDGTTIAEECLEPELVREVMRRWNTLGISYVLYNNDTMFYSVKPLDYDKYPEYGARMGAHIQCDFDRDRMMGEGAEHAHKLVYYDDDTEMYNRAVAMLTDLKDILELNSSSRNNIEVMHKGVDKGWAVRQLQKYYGLKREEIMAFGDADNDRQMLLNSGWPVVMSNGTDEMKAIARIIAPDCDSSGVGQIIEEYVLSGKIK